MQCPCCGSESEKEILICGNVAVINGQRYHIQPAVGLTLNKLYKAYPNGVRLEETKAKNSRQVAISLLRMWLRYHKLPYSIYPIRGFGHKLHKVGTPVHDRERNAS